MRATDPRIADRRIEFPARPASPSPKGIVARAASIAAGRVPSERWLTNLVALALASLLVGAAALYGLALVSACMTTPNQPAPDVVTHEGLTATSVAPGAWADLLCCHETQ